MAIGVAPDGAEEAWVEKLVTFNEAEVIAAREDSSLAHWSGIVARFEAFELDLRRPVQDLRWRASLLQGLSRRAREPRVAAAAFG